MNVKDACLKKNTVRRKRMYVCPVKPVIENDSKKELQLIFTYKQETHHYDVK